jgi:hypothetical protein
MILMYEDEPYFIDEYVDRITGVGYFVQIVDRADSFLKQLKESFNEIELIILDLMVYGPGNEFPGKDPDDGKNSGLYLLQEIEKLQNKQHLFPKKKILVFTNRKGIDVRQIMKEFPSVLDVIHKPDTLPSELIEKINDFISR